MTEPDDNIKAAAGVLNYGPFRLTPPLIEAALSGYSDAPMRRLAKRFGCPMALCEVFLDRFVMEVTKRSKARFYLAVKPEDHPCGAQLMGSEPEEFRAAALRLLQCGFDLIDLNFACPVKKVLGRARGGSLMADPRRALEIVQTVREALPDSVPLSVKLRKGFDETPGSEEDFFTLLDGLLSRGVAGITLHGRTVQQGYQGKSDWDFIRNVKRYLIEDKKRPDFFVIGSGDLFTADDCVKRYRETSVDGLALARGVIGNPWLFPQAAAALAGEPIPPSPDLEEQKEVILRHWSESEALYGAKRTTMMMRKFLIRYAALHPKGEEVKRAFVSFRGREGMENVLRRFYK